ncbi:dual specificity phosphatase [Pseudomassariella vexata]|uniref:Dual specificity phosphatase n=1 Tax=Pseudomassariella vexata TaxID=1141098 RepID=A0A1Y2E209_9PEZI|nr:dual specificity phosphatase [Pseudomassariella vexata]ORY65562.1 dual specificity phosphatase [Pseudomassariella vexata]
MSTSSVPVTAVPTAPYSARPPSPPAILIPAPPLANSNQPIQVVPAYNSIDPLSLSAQDLAIITQGKAQTAHDSGCNWNYEHRRKAQQITDWLYLGPSNIARDKEWLQANGITMLLAARDSRMAQFRLMAVGRVAQELGIEAEHIDVSGNQELIRAFPDAIRKINNHLLRIYHEQAVSDWSQQVQDGRMVIDKTNFRRGKVLVFCETGNDRSAGLVIAYLMSIFGLDLVRASQFVTFRRFCISIDEEMKYLLKTYEDILTAQRTVHKFQIAVPQITATLTSAKKSKRRFDDTMSNDDEAMAGTGSFLYDIDRYVGRADWAPFQDSTKDDVMGED